MKLLIKELRPELWADLERLFGEKGACGGCWCMYCRIEQGEKWENIKGKIREASALAQRAADVARKVLGTEHPDTKGYEQLRQELQVKEG